MMHSHERAHASSHEHEGEARVLHQQVEDREEIDAAYEMFLQRREVFDTEAAHHNNEHFRTQLRGGKWTVRFKSLPCDA
eukprot:363534-Amphidinium_carterae.1